MIIGKKEKYLEGGNGGDQTQISNRNRIASSPCGRSQKDVQKRQCVMNFLLLVVGFRYSGKYVRIL